MRVGAEEVAAATSSILALAEEHGGGPGRLLAALDCDPDGVPLILGSLVGGLLDAAEAETGSREIPVHDPESGLLAFISISCFAAGLIVGRSTS